MIPRARTEAVRNETSFQGGQNLEIVTPWLTFPEYLLHARCCYKDFAPINSFSGYKNPES